LNSVFIIETNRRGRNMIHDYYQIIRKEVEINIIQEELFAIELHSNCWLDIVFSTHNS